MHTHTVPKAGRASQQRPKRIVITGAAGLVGLNLLTTLDSRHYTIVAIDKDLKKIGMLQRLFPAVTAVHADVSYPGPWEEHFKNAHCVVQLHAQISASTDAPYLRNNVTAVNVVIGVCKKYRVKHLIHLSSSVVISVSHDWYVKTKKEGEDAVFHSGLPFTILRPPLLYGCFDYKHLGMLTRIMEQSPIFPVPGSGRYMRQPLFVGDLCAVIRKLIESKPERRIYNVIGKEKIDFIDLLKEIRRQRGLRCVFVCIPIPVFIMMLRIHSLIFRKKPFVKAQLYALIAGDDFPVDPWDDYFKVRYTRFKEGIASIIRSPWYRYRYGHKEQ